jgi:hypothetical protein
MCENRAEPRELIFRTALIAAKASDPAIDCAVLNESLRGASLLVPRGTTVPKEFSLVMNPGGGSRLCQVMWQEDCRLGVLFVDGRTDPETGL